MHISRTTLNLPTHLIKEAQKVLGTKTKTETIVLALKDIIRKNIVKEGIKKMAGKTDFIISPKKMRQIRKSR